MKIKSFVMTRSRARMSLRARRILRITTRAVMRMRIRPILTMVSLMPCLMICLVTRELPLSSHGKFICFSRYGSDQTSTTEGSSSTSETTATTETSYNNCHSDSGGRILLLYHGRYVVHCKIMKYFNYLITVFHGYFCRQ